MRVYLPGARPLPRAGAHVKELDMVVLPGRPPLRQGQAARTVAAPGPPSGFRLAAARRAPAHVVFRFMASRPRLVVRSDLRNELFPDGAGALEQLGP